MRGVTERELSPLEEAVARVGDRWTLLIVEALLDGPRRFNELGGLVAGIAPNILSARLRALEQDGLVVAEPYSDRPRRFVYELIGTGLSGSRRRSANACGGVRPSSRMRPTIFARFSNASSKSARQTSFALARL